MKSALEILILYALVAAVVLLVARSLGRRIPYPSFSLAFLLPIVFVWRCLFYGLTPLPVDHARAIPPWSGASTPKPYNENFNDAVTQIAPWQKAVRQAWKEGSLPLWNRWNGCGMPLAAAGLAEAFSPFTFLMFPLPLASAFTLLLSVKLFLAFVGLWLWLSEMRVSPTAAALGGVSFAFSLTMTGWLLFPQTSSLCLWPWALFGSEVVRDPARRFRGTFLLMGVFAISALGHPEITALGVLLLLLWVIGREISQSSGQPRQVLTAIGLAGLAALGLTAFLLIPEAFAIAASNRAEAAESLWRRLPFSLKPHGPIWKGYLTILFPSSLGDGVSTKRLETLSPASFLETGLSYFGLIPWALALCFFRKGKTRRRPQAWILVALMVVGGGVALGCWPFFEVFLHLPLLRLTPPLRYLAWVSVAGSALAGLELDRLQKDLEQNRRSVIPLILFLLAIGIAAFVVFQSLTPSYRAVGDLVAQGRTVVWTAALAGLGILVGAVAVATKRSRLLGPFLVIVTCLELIPLGQHLYRFGSPSELFPQSPLIAFLQRQTPPFRVLGEGPYLFPSTNVFAGLEDIRTHDAAERRDYLEYLNRTAGYEPTEYFKFIRDVNAGVLDKLNVKFLVTSPDRAPPSNKWRLVYTDETGRVFENTDVWPRVFAVDPRTGSIDRTILTISNYQETTNTVSFVARASGTVPVVAHTSIVTDGGWSAHSDQKDRVTVGRVDGLFLSLALPPGQHRIIVRYRPLGFGLGAVASAVAAAVIAAVVWSRRRPARPPESL